MFLYFSLFHNTQFNFTDRLHKKILFSKRLTIFYFSKKLKTIAKEMKNFDFKEKKHKITI